LDAVALMPGTHHPAFSHSKLTTQPFHKSFTSQTAAIFWTAFHRLLDCFFKYFCQAQQLLHLVFR